MNTERRSKQERRIAAERKADEDARRIIAQAVADVRARREEQR